VCTYYPCQTRDQLTAEALGLSGHVAAGPKMAAKPNGAQSSQSDDFTAPPIPFIFIFPVFSGINAMNIFLKLGEF